MSKYFGPFLALVCFSVVAFGFWVLSKTVHGKEPDYLTEYHQALSLARNDGKSIILIFTASWCPPCQHMKKNVYPSIAVSQVADRFHWVMLDVDRQEAASLAQQFGVRGIPHIQMVDSSGQPKSRLVGKTSASHFADFLKSQL